MRRRDFIGGLGGTVACPLAARAQQTGRVPRVGHLWIGAPGTDESFNGLRQGLEERGYVLGRNLILEQRYANWNAEHVPTLIAELLALKVDVLTTPGTLISLAAQRATSIVPIVLVSADPVGARLVTSLPRPGANITGLSVLSTEYSAKWPQLLKELAPRLRRVGLLWNQDNQSISGQVERVRETARALDLELTALSARPAEIEATLAAMTTASIDGFIVVDDTSLRGILDRLIVLATERALPALYGFGIAIKKGGLMSYSANFFELWRQAAFYVDRILRGARAADLPIEQATRFSLGINLKTAKALGLTVPKTILVSADEVIE